MDKTLLIAIGGNSLMKTGDRATIKEQLVNAGIIASKIADVAELGYRIVITHGNGPQVGAQLLRSEVASAQTYIHPLDVCVSTTQGEIGYLLQNTLQSVLKLRRLDFQVATIVTRVVVDSNDAAFNSPTKPIGPFYKIEEAQSKAREFGWSIIEDSARGYRRVVPSPDPKEIVELEVIRRCIDDNTIVIAAGGGGIPVVYKNGNITGVEAVVDKDKTSALLASHLEISRLVISTDVDFVYLNYVSSSRTAIKSMRTEEAKRFLAEGHFGTGSMKPKIEAALNFLSTGGKEVIITNSENLVGAISGQNGTHIFP
ncbi:MAG: carbamate kinase [Candidatus Kryptoniota bacterium]